MSSAPKKVAPKKKTKGPLALEYKAAVTALGGDNRASKDHPWEVRRPSRARSTEANPYAHPISSSSTPTMSPTRAVRRAEAQIRCANAGGREADHDRERERSRAPSRRCPRAATGHRPGQHCWWCRWRAVNGAFVGCLKGNLWFREAAAKSVRIADEDDLSRLR